MTAKTVDFSSSSKQSKSKTAKYVKSKACGYYYTTNAKRIKYDKKAKKMLNMIPNSDNTTNFWFDRFYSIYPYQELTNLIQYVFFVRADCNILTGTGTKAKLNSQMSSDPFYIYMYKRYLRVLECLTDNFNSSHDFMPFLVGRTESLQLPDYTLKSNKIMQPYTGLGIPYASHGLESTSGGTFEVSFREASDLRVQYFFYAWLKYIDGVTRNIYSPKNKYINKNKFDYCTSVYLITCEPDGESIVHWSKYTGAFPTNAPISELSFNLRSGSVPNKPSFTFEYFKAEHFNPYILQDFNKNAHVTDKSKITRLKMYDSDALSTGYAPAGSPFIYREKKSNIFKLYWKARTD